MISVCIATYNGERFIKRQLETILQQIGKDDEIIISDDKSTDNTIKIIKAINAPVIHLYINEGEHGYTPNFENALKHARGEYIFLADQDDIWMPNKVETCMKFLIAYDLVVSDAIIVDREENLLYTSFFEKRRHYTTFWGNMLTMGYIGCCMAFRKNILSKVLPFPPNHKLCTHDNWILITGLRFYRVKFLKEKLIAYRRHDKNASVGQESASASTFFRIQYRLYLLIHLFKRKYY